MLSKQCRIRKQQEINEILKTGKKFSVGPLRLYWRQNSQLYSRFAFLIKKHTFENAVLRNRWRRVMREVIRLHYKRIVKGQDIVFVLISPPTHELKLAVWEKLVCDLLGSIGLLDFEQHVRNFSRKTTS